MGRWSSFRAVWGTKSGDAWRKRMVKRMIGWKLGGAQDPRLRKDGCIKFVESLCSVD